MALKRNIYTDLEAACDRCKKVHSMRIHGAVPPSQMPLPQGWTIIDVMGLPLPVNMQMENVLEGKTPNGDDEGDYDEIPKRGYLPYNVLHDGGKSQPIQTVLCQRMLCEDCVEKFWDFVGHPKNPDGWDDDQTHPVPAPHVKTVQGSLGLKAALRQSAAMSAIPSNVPTPMDKARERARAITTREQFLAVG